MAEKEPEGSTQGKGLPRGALTAAGVAAALGALAFSRVRLQARRRGHEEALAQLADETGCDFTSSQPGSARGPDFPSLSGSYRGREVSVRTEVSGLPLEYHYHTRTTAAHTAAVDGFIVIREETLLTRLGDRLGLKDIQVGEAAFDERFEVSSDLRNAAEFLHPEIRDALLASRFESFVIRSGEVLVRQEGPVADPTALRQALKLAVEVAEWLETLA